MTEGFYEQLGVGLDATPAEIRTAFANRVAQIVKRRRAITEQGGDAAPLDLTRSQLDEAHAVLGDPRRRRRYDAMLAIAEERLPTGTDAEAELWRRAAGALVSPAASVAAELVRVSTNLKVGALLPVPRPTAPEDERTVTAAGGRRRERTATRPIEDRVVPLHAGATNAPKPAKATDPGLRVVDGTRSGAAPVVVMPTAPPRPTDPGTRPRVVPKPLSAEDLARLVDKHGFSGPLFRAVREARGLSLQALSDTTRISSKYLEAIETEAAEGLPSTTFVRGYVREVARQLGLDEEAAVAGYVRRLSR